MIYLLTVIVLGMWGLAFFGAGLTATLKKTRIAIFFLAVGIVSLTTATALAGWVILALLS